MLTHFETSVFELFTFTSTNSTSSLLECLLSLFIHSFCSSSFHLFSLLSLRVFSFLFYCSLFLIFFFSWSWIVSLTFFFCLLLFTKNTILFVSFLVGHVLQLCFLLCLVFLCLEKWFLVFVLTLLCCFLFLLLHMQFLIYYFPVLMYLKKCCFSSKFWKTSSVFLFLPFFFFFFCSLVFFGW